MAYDNGVISKPISTTDVCSVIGSDNHDVGALCVHENLNANSKHKPMRYTTLSELTTQQKISVNWGYHIPSLARVDQIVPSMINEESGSSSVITDWIPSNEGETSANDYVYIHYGWWYQRPKGGSTNPYRMGDFNGYNHNTVFFVGCELSPNDTEIQNGFYVDLKGEINIDDPNDVGTSDFSRLSNKVLLVGALASNDSNPTNMRFKTGPATLPSGTTSYRMVVFSDEDITRLFYNGTGNYNLYYMLVERPTDQSIYVDGYYLPMSNLYKNSQETEYGRVYYRINEYTTNIGTVAMLTTKTQAMTLPCQILPVHYTYIAVRPTDPYEGFAFTSTLGSYTLAANGRMMIYGNLKITNNSGSSQYFSTITVYIQASAFGGQTGNIYTSNYYEVSYTVNATIANNGSLWLAGSASTTENIVNFSEQQFRPNPNGDSTFVNPSASVSSRNRINTNDEWTYFVQCNIPITQ